MTIVTMSKPSISSSMRAFNRRNCRTFSSSQLRSILNDSPRPLLPSGISRSPRTQSVTLSSMNDVASSARWHDSDLTVFESGRFFKSANSANLSSSCECHSGSTCTPSQMIARCMLRTVCVLHRGTIRTRPR